MQPFHNRNLYIRRDPFELARVLNNKDHANQRVLCDVDGTLHRGIYDPLLRGVTNADLALYVSMWMPVSKLPRFARENIEIFAYDRRTLANGVRMEEREAHTRHLIFRFLDALESVPRALIGEAAATLPRLAYPDARKTLARIEGGLALVSCGLQPVVEAYGRHLGTRWCFGNPLKSEDVDLGGAADKAKYANDICRRMNRAIVIGDTEDDLGMAEVAKALNPESVVIAMHHRSEALEEKADIIAYSWGDLAQLLYVY